MRFHQTELHGAWLIEPVPASDSRGFFARTFCEQEFAEHRLATQFVQHSISHSRTRGTLRGMHFQRAPHGEVKVVRCLHGTVWDVVIDLRPDSPTYRLWQGFELTAENGRQLYVPQGFAHGFQTLCDDARVGYLISEFYMPAAASGVRYDDPAFHIRWPLPVTTISEKDQTWPDFRAGPAVPAPRRRLQARQQLSGQSVSLVPDDRETSPPAEIGRRDGGVADPAGGSA